MGHPFDLSSETSRIATERKRCSADLMQRDGRKPLLEMPCEFSRYIALQHLEYFLRIRNDSCPKEEISLFARIRRGSAPKIFQSLCQGFRTPSSSSQRPRREATPVRRNF